MIITHTYLSIRMDRSSIDACAIITLDADQLLHDKDGAWNQFKSGITEWIKTTNEGKRVWEESCEDLNIGDLLNDEAFNNPDLIRILEQKGVTNVTAKSFNDADFKEYDEVLAYDDEISNVE